MAKLKYIDRAGEVHPLNVPLRLPAQRTAWYRPPDWPDITKMPYTHPDSELGDGTGKYVEFWCTIDTQIGTSITINKLYNDSAVSVGTVKSGVFTAYESYDDTDKDGKTLVVDVDESYGRFQVMHIIDKIPSSQATNSEIYIDDLNAPIVEIKASKYKLIGGYGTTCLSAYLKAVTVTHAYAASYGGFNLPCNVEYIDISSVETILANLFVNNLPQLREIAWPVLEEETHLQIPTNGISGWNKIKEIDLSWAKINCEGSHSIASLFGNCYLVETINISDCDFSEYAKYSSKPSVFANNVYLKNIVTNSATKLPAWSFTMGETYQGKQCCDKLTDESLVNVANALVPVQEATTLTLHATPKARLSEIMGTVADGRFTPSDGGTVTLLNYITNTKGWTVA